LFWVWLVVVGFVLGNIGFLMGRFVLPQGGYGGTIVAQKKPDGKLVYTLVIGGDLDKLQYEKDVLLKVVRVSEKDNIDEELLDRK